MENKTIPELKKLLVHFNIKNRSKLTTKQSMIDALKDCNTENAISSSLDAISSSLDANEIKELLIPILEEFSNKINKEECKELWDSYKNKILACFESKKKEIKPAKIKKVSVPFIESKIGVNLDQTSIKINIIDDNEKNDEHEREEKEKVFDEEDNLEKEEAKKLKYKPRFF
jgi:hypothetical protein